MPLPWAKEDEFSRADFARGRYEEKKAKLLQMAGLHKLETIALASWELQMVLYPTRAGWRYTKPIEKPEGCLLVFSTPDQAYIQVIELTVPMPSSARRALSVRPIPEIYKDEDNTIHILRDDGSYLDFPLVMSKQSESVRYYNGEYEEEWKAVQMNEHVGGPDNAWKGDLLSYFLQEDSRSFWLHFRELEQGTYRSSLDTTSDRETH